MGYTTVRIVNCKKASIRRTPWITWHNKDMSGVLDGPLHTSDDFKKGDELDVDFDSFCYDWTGRKFYKVRMPKGWIYEGVIERKETLDG